MMRSGRENVAVDGEGRIWVPAADFLSIHDWIAPDLWSHFTEHNGNREPSVIHIRGRLEDTILILDAELNRVPSTELTCLLLHNYIGSSGSERRKDHRILIDRAPTLRRQYLRVWHGKPVLGQAEFDLGISYYPERHAIHIHTVSLGRGMTNSMRGKRLMSQTFQRVVGVLRTHYVGAAVSAVILAPPAEHWFKKYFGGKRLASSIERSRLEEYVHVGQEHRDRLMIGSIGRPTRSDTTK
ncbi:MAG: hypothetical protein KDD44_00510 [Bdellovibrionales bacterium]|nr:hypothetical protein [Bdellovibrionales bacterium]